MEKLTYKPLLELLQENAENLNQVLKSFATSAGGLDSTQIHFWFKQMIEPVFIAVHEHDATKSRRVFDVVYRFMLKALTSKLDQSLAFRLALLLQLNPALFALNPGRMLNAIHAALLRISRHSPEAAEKWLEIMEQIVPLLQHEKELLESGRIAAWRCGLAHLRSLITDLNAIDTKIATIIFADEKEPTQILSRRWPENAGVKALAAGGFAGFGGPFAWPPLVSLKGETVFAFDGQKIAALFADRYGFSFQDCPAEIKDNLRFSGETGKKISPAVNRILKRYVDMTSWVYHDETLYLTTSSSHSVFVFGALHG